MVETPFQHPAFLLLKRRDGTQPFVTVANSGIKGTLDRFAFGSKRRTAQLIATVTVVLNHLLTSQVGENVANPIADRFR